MEKKLQPEIIIAIDGMEINQALSLARLLSGHVWGFKITDLLLDAGTQIIHGLHEFGLVFCDPKLCDIPSTVANSVQKLSRAGADIISVHAAEDIKILIAAVKNRGSSKIIGISNLTSIEKPSYRNLMLAAYNILISRADGLVLSGKDIKTINRKREYKKLLKIVPGIRPLWWNSANTTENKADDQKRVTTPEYACQAGADFLVIGRPITGSDDPVATVEKIKKEIIKTQEPFEPA